MDLDRMEDEPQALKMPQLWFIRTTLGAVVSGLGQVLITSNGKVPV